MKKIIVPIILSFILFTGCGEKLNNTPTKQVEMFFMNYQTLNQKVIDDLDNVLKNDNTMTNDQKEKYKEIMKKHYKNLTYDIKDEVVNEEVFFYDKCLEVLTDKEKKEFLNLVEKVYLESKKYRKNGWNYNEK